jgi:thiol-disulfide isomerase/thioredoxin
VTGRRGPARTALAVALAAATLGLATCRPRPSAGTADAAATPPWVLVVNGGGTKQQNYRSHLLHVRELLGLLDRAGVPRERITVFSSDGDDPEPDVATRETRPEADFWLVEGTHLERALTPPIRYEDTTLPGVAVRPARRDALAAWFDDARGRLHAGDTLLLYVTDHGTKNQDDTRNNAITLWGKGEELPVSALREMLERLDPGVRVVMLMSQCFSGAFAHLIDAHARDAEPRGDVCGYFASTEDRPAYGCYPENRGRANVGHSFHFFQALTETSRFPDAHARTLVTDRTPDVPLRSSDVYLEEVVARAARATGTEPAAYTDALLAEAWRDRGAWEPEIRLLDRIAQSFGIFSPRSIREIEQQAQQLPEISEQLRTHGRAWHEARTDAAEANLERFLADEPGWRERTSDVALATYQPPAVHDLTADLLRHLRRFTGRDRATTRRLRMLRERDAKARDAAYRMDVRLGAVLRMRYVLERVAGRVYLATHGTAAERAAYASLLACEDFTPGPTEGAVASTDADTAPFPPYADDVALAGDVLPAWMGINFRPATVADRERLDLPGGAAAVMAVYPDSPAATAGLQPGDFVLGPPGRPFSEPRQIREWIMLSRIGDPLPLDLVRGGDHLEVSLVPKPFPVAWPKLPGPPKEGTPAPALKLGAYRGAVPAALAGTGPHLLFFWATWCAPCKASLPELLAFEAERHTPVVAITDEPREQLDKFFTAWKQPFPETVAIDEYRGAFLAYGVSGTPAFVLVDGDGIVRGHTTGYAPDKGLALDGWTWAKRPAQ